MSSNDANFKGKYSGGKKALTYNSNDKLYVNRRNLVSYFVVCRSPDNLIMNTSKDNPDYFEFLENLLSHENTLHVLIQFLKCCIILDALLCISCTDTFVFPYNMYNLFHLNKIRQD